MTLLIIRMNVFPEKRIELSQTISSLFVSTRMQQGCRRCDFYQSVEDENRLVLLQEWDTIYDPPEARQFQGNQRNKEPSPRTL